MRRGADIAAAAADGAIDADDAECGTVGWKIGEVAT